MKLDFKNNDQVQKFALKLIHCESPEELEKILKDYNLWDVSNWRFYGDNSNNIGTIGNQSPDASKALVEKITNSIDARLMLECKLRGNDPKNTESNPKNIKEAMENYFYSGSKFKNFLSLENENAIFATNDLKRPCISLVDKGEGQTPEEVPNTIFSLNKENKQGVLFTQGKYNQGGSGALKFCFKGLSLLLTKKNPEINKDKSGTNNHWSISITREVSAKERGLNEPCYMYLAPVENGRKILHNNKTYSVKDLITFEADKLKLFPNGMQPYSLDSDYGTLMKFYGYQMKGADENIMFKFLYNLEIMMPDAVMPIRLHECRENYKKREGEKTFRQQVTTMQGFMFRHSNNKSIEPNYPLIEQIDFKGHKFNVWIYAFKYEPGTNFTNRRRKNNEGVIFCLGGQHYGDYKAASFFRRNKVNMDYLKDDLIIVVDCSSIDGDLKNKLFKTDKATILDTDEMNELESQIEDLIGNNESLLELKNIRRKQRVGEQLKDEKPFEDVLKEVIKKNPALASLFNIGNRLSNPFAKKDGKDGTKKIKTDLQYNPTYFKFQKKLDQNETYERTANINKKMRFDFFTDAVDDFFLREKEKGEYRFDITVTNKETNKTEKVLPTDITSRQYLKNGEWLVSLDIPKIANTNDILDINFYIENSSQKNIWKLTSKVIIEEEGQSKKNKSKSKSKKKQKQSQGNNIQAGFDLPKVQWKGESEWHDYGFDKESAMTCIKAETKILNGKEIELWDFYLNSDNIYLLNELKKNKKLDENIIRERYKLALVFFSLSLINQNKKLIDRGDDIDIVKDIQRLTSGISPVVLDVIESLGDLVDSIEI